MVGYLKTLNYLKRIALSDQTHMMSMVGLVAIVMEIAMMNLCTKFMYTNP